jgi:hypothetical protein
VLILSSELCPLPTPAKKEKKGKQKRKNCKIKKKNEMHTLIPNFKRYLKALNYKFLAHRNILKTRETLQKLHSTHICVHIT